MSPIDSKPCDSISALIQATCDLGSLTQCVISPSQHALQARSVVRSLRFPVSTSGSGALPSAKKTSGDNVTNAHACTSAGFADPSVELQ